MSADVLTELRTGGPDSMGRLVPLVYRELRHAAHRQAVARGPGNTLETGALVHETYVQLVDQTRAEPGDRTRFLIVASLAMRHLLVDRAKARRLLDGGVVHAGLALDAEALDPDAQADVVLHLHEALERLARSAPRLVRVVECRFFGGLAEDETASALDVSVPVVRRDWAKARALLRRARLVRDGAESARAADARTFVPDDWSMMEPLFDALLDTPPDRRAARAAELAGADDALRAQLEGLLEECDRGAPLLDRPAAERFPALFIDAAGRIAVALADRYRLTRELGHGGMAVVYLARDVRHGRDVAVKVVHAELAVTVGRERFLREVEIAARLHHPNIVPLYDSGEADGFLYYVMPYEPGHSLRERLDRDGPLPTGDALVILRDVCDALAYAHQQGIVHRDIKPDNVLLSGRHAFVTDFGIARAMSARDGHTMITTAGVALGTPVYMAPEQISADPNIDHRADIYAFGVLAYEVLVGRPPFAGQGPQRILAAHLTEAAEPLGNLRPDVPPELSELVARCLAKAPADRWQRSDELLARLEALGAPPVPASPGRRTTRVAVALSLGLVAVAAAGVLLLRSDDAPAFIVGRAVPFTSDPGLEVEPAISPDGRWVAYAAGTSARMRIVIRPVGEGRASHVSSDTTAVESQPRWSPDGERILFLSHGGVSVAPAFGGRVRQVVPRSASAPVRSAAWSPNGSEMAVVRGDSLLVFSADGARTRFVGPASEWHSCTWSPTGSRLACIVGNPRYVQPGAFFANIGPSAIVIVGTSDGQRIAITDPTAAAINQSPQWSADGGHLLFVSDRDGPRDIYAVTIASEGRPHGEAHRLTFGLNVHSFGLDAANGKLAYAVYRERGNIWSLPIPDRPPVTIDDAVPLTSGSQVVEIPRIRRGDRWLYYDSNLHGNNDIFRIPAAGGEPERLTSDPSLEFAPEASPSGTEFAYHRFRGGQRDVLIQRLSGGDAEELAATEAQECCPTWSPDGNAIAFSHFSAEGSVFVMRRDAAGRWGEPVRRLPRGFLQAWSPDGKLLAVASGRRVRGNDHVGLLELIHPDSGGPVTLYAVQDTVNDPYVGDPHWSADGTAVYFKSHDSIGRASIWRQSLAGGRPQLLVRFDDLMRPSFRANFTTDGRRFYFVINERESDVWLADLTLR